MATEPILRKKDLLYPELSYKILGSAFRVWSGVGFGHKEAFYQKALAQDFRTSGIMFHEQLPAKLSYQGKIIGLYYFDFLVEDKIVVELKVRNFFTKKDIQQVYGYLKAKNLQLGIIIHFTQTGVKSKRIINI